jgi:hypothetical protein
MDTNLNIYIKSNIENYMGIYKDTEAYNQVFVEGVGVNLDKFIYQKNYYKWYRYNELHRNNGNPAVVYGNGAKFWYQHGKKHRDGDQPATCSSDGSKSWWQHGVLSRKFNLPNIIYSDGSLLWRYNGRSQVKRMGVYDNVPTYWEFTYVDINHSTCCYEIV